MLVKYKDWLVSNWLFIVVNFEYCLFGDWLVKIHIVVPNLGSVKRNKNKQSF